MKRVKLFFAVTALLFSTICYSQQIKETVKTDSVEHQMTISETDMYGGTKSKEARDFYNQAKYYEDKKDLVKAKQYYMKAIQTDSAYIEAYDNLGLTFRRLGEYDKAIEYYKKSTALYPKGILAHQNLAAVYALTNDFVSADKEYQEIIEMSPDDPEGYFGLANSRMMQSHFDEALEFANKALKLYEAQNSTLLSEGQYLVGLIYYYKGEKDNAKIFIKKAKKNGAKIHPQIEKELNL